MLGGRRVNWRVEVSNLAVVVFVLSTTTKKSSTFFRKKSAPPEKNPGYAYALGHFEVNMPEFEIKLEASVTKLMHKLRHSHKFLIVLLHVAAYHVLRDHSEW